MDMETFKEKSIVCKYKYETNNNNNDDKEKEFQRMVATVGED